MNALGELSPGGALMRGFQEQSLARTFCIFINFGRRRIKSNDTKNRRFLFAELVPPDVEKELRNLYLSLSELLKHFWNSFPPTTPECESKAVRMHEALQRFQMAKLKPFEVKFLLNQNQLSLSLTY